MRMCARVCVRMFRLPCNDVSSGALRILPKTANTSSAQPQTQPTASAAVVVVVVVGVRARVHVREITIYVFNAVGCCFLFVVVG